jgi:hypothetical protein
VLGGLRGQYEKDRRGKHGMLNPREPLKQMDKPRKQAKKTVQLFSNINRGMSYDSSEEDYY